MLTLEESNQIPVHELRDAQRQLLLPSVREFEQSEVVQQEQPGFNNAIVGSSSSQQEHDVDMLDLHNRRLSNNPREVMSPNQAHPDMPLEVDTNRERKYSVKRAHVCIMNSVDLKE